MKFPEIDRQLATRQLALLGHSINEPVYLRFFYPSDDPRKDGDAGRKADKINWNQIEKYQKEGRGAYFVINGGGHKNSDVTTGKAIFIEHDHLPKEEQLNLWKTLQLPEPTFQVDTGGKSIHSYWVFKEAVVVEKWCQLQKDLLEYGDGDRSIKNPARVMRLAGGWHISHDENGNPIYNQTKIITASAKTYSYEELREIIPEKKERLPIVEATLNTQKEFSTNIDTNLPRHPDQIQIPVPASVPLLQCCRKEVREWVATGVAKGSGRNDTAINVGLELIAVERYLQSIGQSHTDTAASVFHEFCWRSQMSTSEEEERLKWCQNTNSDPSCPPDTIEACIKGWYWREIIKTERSRHVKPQNRSLGHQSHIIGQQDNTESTNISKSGDVSTEQPPRGLPPSQRTNKDSKEKPSINLLDAVKKILREFPQESLQHIALMNLSAKSGYRYRELELLARIIEREDNIEEETAEAIASLSMNLNLYQQRLDITQYLEKDFADLMVEAADAMPTAVEYLFNTLVPVVAACGGTSSTVRANGTGGYEQPLIFWTGNVAHSGQAKTPPQQVIIKPLIEMEAEANDKYNLLKREYEQDKSGEIPRPTRERLMMTNVTITTKIRIHGENPRGLLEYMDELASDFRRLNQYKKGGVGDDREQELSFFNGSSVSYDRSDAHLFLDKTALSKTGTIQWDTLSKLMDNPGFIESGYMARFLLCSIGNSPKRYLDLFQKNNAVPDLQHRLKWLYKKMRELPEQNYLLDHDAKVLFQAWNHTLVDFGMREYNHALSLVYPKIECYTLRLALWLHLVNSILRGETPPNAIDGYTMKAAIEISSFYLGQHQLIFAHTDKSNQLEGILLKIQTKANEVYQQTELGVSASWAKKNFNALKKMTTDEIRTKYLQVLANSGYGRLEGEGKSLKYTPYPQQFCSLFPRPKVSDLELNHQPVDDWCKNSGESIVTAISEMPIQKALQEKVDKIDEQTYTKILSKIIQANQSAQQHKKRFSNIAQSSFSNESKPKHQTTNQSPPNLDNNSVLEVEESPQFAHQPPINEPPKNNTDIQWLMKLLSDLQENTCLHSEEEWLDLFKEAEQKINCLDGFSQQYPNYWELIWSAYSSTPQPTSPVDSLVEQNYLVRQAEGLETATELETADAVDAATQPTQPTQPTLDELKLQLLACKNWVELKNLQKQHGQQFLAVYTALTNEQQSLLDAVAATQVNQDVYKYVGPQRKVDGIQIEPGTLVYLDPHSTNKNRPHLKVRLLQGINQSWQKVVEISRDALQAVEKRFNHGLDAIEGHQGNLLDGLS